MAVTFEQITQFVATVGIPAAFCFALLGMMWWTLKAVTPTLKDAVKRHVSLMETLERNSDRTTQTLEKQAELIEVLDGKHDNPHSPFATIHTNEALRHASHAMDELADDDKIERVKIHTEAMRKSLE